MDQLEKKETWEEQKIRMKAIFVEIGQEDFLFGKGKREEMMNHLVLKLGKSRAELDAIIANL